MKLIYLALHFIVIVPLIACNVFFLCILKVKYTRWFKYDWDICGLFTHKSVPVIFEPPCILVMKRISMRMLTLLTYTVIVLSRK